MNERILELADKAERYAWKNGGKKYNAFGDSTGEWENAMMEKFAELILREAADVADDNFNAGGCPVGYFILKHFGVEK